MFVVLDAKQDYDNAIKVACIRYTAAAILLKLSKNLVYNIIGKIIRKYRKKKTSGIMNKEDRRNEFLYSFSNKLLNHDLDFNDNFTEVRTTVPLPFCFLD
jgi:hypothetical protein